VSVAQFRTDDGILREAFDFPLGHIFQQEDLGMTAEITSVGNLWMLTVQTQKFARLVHIDIPHFRAKEDWVDIAPNNIFVTELVCNDSTSSKPTGYVLALNASSSISVKA
jgi:hypothetical protein